MRKATTCTGLALLFGVALMTLSFGVATAQTPILINEIRIDQPGADNDEYFELSGPPGASLDGLTYLVIGDTGSTGTCGIIEAVVDLTGLVIPADGHLLVGEATMTLATPDAILNVNFENSDNVTHMLVRGFTGSDGQKLDTNDDGTLDITPWGGILDCVGLDEGTVPNCSGDEYLYCGTTVGPDGSFVPGHVYRCGNAWMIGAFDPSGGDDTPGKANSNCPVPAESSTWGKVKDLYR